MRWFAKSMQSTEGDGFDLTGFIKQPLAILFKHSQTCPVSWFAQRHVQEFAKAHPEVPLHTVIVQTDKELSRTVSQVTGVQHESPQVFVFRNGKAVANTSHEGITAEYLSRAVRGDA